MAFLPVIRLNTQLDMGYAIRKRVGGIIKALKSIWLGWLFSVAMALGIVGSPALGQAVVLNPQDVLPELLADDTGTALFYINGTLTHGLPKGANGELDGAQFYNSSIASKLIISLVALRLSDMGLIAPEALVSDYLPDIVPIDPFEAPITIRHLLQETAGFASPPLSLEPHKLDAPLSGVKLRRFAIKLRSPDQASSHDPVGWAVLVALLEKASGKPFTQLVADQITAPLGLGAKNVMVSYQSLGGDAVPVVTEVSLAAFAEIVRLLIRNRDQAGGRYLGRITHSALVQGTEGFRLHPAGPTASSAITVRSTGGLRWIEGLNTDCSDPLAFAAYSEQGIAFIGATGSPAGTGSCPASTVRGASLAQAAKYFPPKANARTSASQIARPSKLEGRYIPARRSPAALAERLTIMQSDWLTIYGHSGEQLQVRRRNGDPAIFTETAPYQYRNTEENAPTSTMIFSPFRLGGYLLLGSNDNGNTLFRRIDILGRGGPLASIIPWTLLIIASAGFYAFRQPEKPWRNMGRFALAGALLVGVGLYLEVNSWANLLYEHHQPTLITLWRAGLNIGLMLLLALPMFVFSFSRNKTIPTGGAKTLVGPHLTLVAAAALLVFMTMILWGVAGTFAPY